MQTVTRENWPALTDAAGISDKELGRRTSRGYHAIRFYRRGKRRPPLEWIFEVQAILEEKAS